MSIKSQSQSPQSSGRAGHDLAENRQKVDETESENDEVESGNEGDDSDDTIDEGQ